MIRTKIIAIYMVLLLTNLPVKGQKFKELWKFHSKDKVLASPVENEGVIFIGGEDGIFYALNSESGSLNWSFETNGKIQAKAMIFNDIVFFESANVFYALSKNNGTKLWQFDPDIQDEFFEIKGKKYNYKLDPWDDKHSSATAYKGIIYIGSVSGSVYGLNIENGNLEFELKSKANAPIRTTPLAANDRLYFGDWNGVVYCYDLVAKKIVWQKNTFRGEKLYPSYGGIASEFMIYKDILIFGARNHMLNALLIENGEKEWTYSDPERGWIIGDPFIFNEILYIGGSDNFKMFAFQPDTGAKLWDQNCGKNIYSKPVVTDSMVIYTAGNAYNPNDFGKLVMIDRIEGNLISEIETPKATFSSPILIRENRIVFGCYDGYIYCYEIIK